VLPALAALAAVVVIALPVFSLRLGLDDAGSDQSTTTTYQSYELLAKGFGPGFNGPLELVGTLHSKSRPAGVRRRGGQGRQGTRGGGRHPGRAQPRRHGGRGQRLPVHQPGSGPDHRCC